MFCGFALLLFLWLHKTMCMCCSFIVSFLNNEPDPEKDSAAVQDFFSKMEAAFRAHPLWSGCSEDELDSAGDVSIINVLLFPFASSCLKSFAS